MASGILRDLRNRDPYATVAALLDCFLFSINGTYEKTDQKVKTNEYHSVMNRGSPRSNHPTSEC